MKIYPGMWGNLGTLSIVENGLKHQLSKDFGKLKTEVNMQLLEAYRQGKISIRKDEVGTVWTQKEIDNATFDRNAILRDQDDGVNQQPYY
jgi:hypothetical protein